MLKGKGVIVYTILKIALFAIGYLEYIEYHTANKINMIIIFSSILVTNSFFRQFYLYGNDKLYWYSKISIIMEFALGAYIASLQPVFVIILFLTTTIFESVAMHSLIFGGSLSAITLFALLTIDTLNQIRILDYFSFYMSRLVSYGLGFILIFIISYLASLQFRERERIAKVNKELEEAYKQLINTSSHLQELSIEKERNRMAREIHDTLAHTLTAVLVQLEACKKLIGVDSSKAKVEIEKAQESTRDGLIDVKNAIKALRPKILENSSLKGAINKLIQDIEDISNVKVYLHESLLQELELSSAMEVALFRVIQESITNAIRHGAAEEINIFLTISEDILHLDIFDNGRGCSHVREGYGLKGIMERVKSLNGTAYFSSTVGKGFRTQIAIPYKGGVSSEN